MRLLRLLKRFIFFIFKEIFSFFIKLSLLIIIFTIIIFSFLNKKQNKIQLKDNFFVEVNLGNKFLEQKIPSLELIDENVLSFYELTDSIKKSLQDDRVDSLILNLENISLSFAQIEELGNLLDKNKGKKLIYSYAENLNKKNFYLSSFTSFLIMPNANSTTVNIFPYFKEEFYVKDFIDRLGIKYNIVNIGDYKTYSENLSHSFMSEQNREDKTRILENKYQNFLKIVTKNLLKRNLNINKNKFSEKIENGDLIATSSVELHKEGLVDELISLDEIKNKLGKEHIVDIYNYKKDYIISKNNSSNKIFILTLEGEIGERKESIFSKISHIGGNKTIRILEKIKNDNNIKAVILRINSPGGSAFVSDKISKKVKEVSKIKPIYTSMGSVCASGGYYIAANSNKIFTDKNTITGSIGVISIIPEITDTLKKLKINNEKIMKGKYADLYSSTNFTEEKYQKIRESNLRVYKDFLEVVSKGRKIELVELKKIAGGRIWTGEEAVKIKLADKIGGLDETIKEIVKDNKISNYSIILSQDEFNLKEVYKNYSGFIKADKLEIMKSSLKSRLYSEELLNKPVTYFPYNEE